MVSSCGAEEVHEEVVHVALLENQGCEYTPRHPHPYHGPFHKLEGPHTRIHF